MVWLHQISNSTLWKVKGRGVLHGSKKGDMLQGMCHFFVDVTLDVAVDYPKIQMHVDAVQQPATCPDSFLYYGELPKFCSQGGRRKLT